MTDHSVEANNMVDRAADCEAAAVAINEMRAERDGLREALRPFAATGQVMNCVNEPGGYVWISYEDENETERTLPGDNPDAPLMGACASWKNFPGAMPGPMLTPAMFVAAWRAIEGWQPKQHDVVDAPSSTRKDGSA
jgi:hypothetical protein